MWIRLGFDSNYNESNRSQCDGRVVRAVGKCAGDSGAGRIIEMRIQIPESAHLGPLNEMCQREWGGVGVRMITEQDSDDERVT